MQALSPRTADREVSLAIFLAFRPQLIAFLLTSAMV